MAKSEYVPSTPLLENWRSSSGSSSTSSDDAGSGTDSNPAPEAVETKKSGGGGGGRHKTLVVLTGHSGPVHCLAVCGEYVLSASDGRDIVAWRQPDLQRFARFGHGGGGSVKALAAVGGRVFSAHQDGRIRVWQVSPRGGGGGGSENAFRLAATLPTARDRLGKILMQGSYVQTRRHHRKLWIEHADSISCLAVDGGAVYSGSWDKTLKVWRLSDLKCIESIKAHDDAVNALAAAGGAVFSASADGKIKIWARSPPALNHSLKGVLEAAGARKGGAVSWNAVVAAADGRAAYGGGSDGRVVVWEQEEGTWRVACEVRAHEMSVLCLSICCKGEVLCSGSADKSIGLWRRASAEAGGGGIYKIGEVRGHEGPVKCVLASGFRVGEGFMLYSGGFDKSLRVWWVDGTKEGDAYKEHTARQIQLFD